jgi:predicted transcriptional regulator
MEAFSSSPARVIYEARTASGLTQQALDTLAGTKQPVIARLKDADGAGHLLSRRHRIPTPLGKRWTTALAKPKINGNRHFLRVRREVVGF